MSAAPAPAGPPAVLSAGAARGQYRRVSSLPGLLLLAGSMLAITPISLVFIRRDAATLNRVAVDVKVELGAMRFTPSELRLPAGKSVRIHLHNADPASPHEFRTFGHYRDTQQVLWPGERRTTVLISASRPGTYAYLCAVRGHTEAGMVGAVVVE